VRVSERVYYREREPVCVRVHVKLIVDVYPATHVAYTRINVCVRNRAPLCVCQCVRGSVRVRENELVRESQCACE